MNHPAPTLKKSPIRILDATRLFLEVSGRVAPPTMPVGMTVAFLCKAATSEHQVDALRERLAWVAQSFHRHTTDTAPVGSRFYVTGILPTAHPYRFTTLPAFATVVEDGAGKRWVIHTLNEAPR